MEEEEGEEEQTEEGVSEHAMIREGKGEGEWGASEEEERGGGRIDCEGSGTAPPPLPSVAVTAGE